MCQWQRDLDVELLAGQDNLNLRKTALLVPVAKKGLEN